MRRIREAARRLEPGAPSPEDLAPLVERFWDALADDFNTPKALEALYEWIREANKREGVGDAACARCSPCSASRRCSSDADGDADAPGRGRRARCWTAREAARAAKDWAEADRLRDELAALGWQVRDAAGGPTLVRP